MRSVTYKLLRVYIQAITPQLIRHRPRCKLHCMCKKLCDVDSQLVIWELQSYRVVIKEIRCVRQ